MPRGFKTFVVVTLAGLSLGLIALWQKQTRPQAGVSQMPWPLVLPSPTASPQSTFVVLEEASSSLEATLASLLARIEKLEQKPAQGSTVTTTTPTQTSFQTQVIYLGSATTTSRDWTRTAVEVTINSADYPADVNASFEAGLSIIGGEAWTRLVNKTTGAIISLSEVFHNTSTTTWKTSPSFKLHSGNNTYVIELRSTSGETANLSGARLRISK